MADFALPVTLRSATFSDQQSHLSQATLPSLWQTETKTNTGVNSTTETRKWTTATLISLITKPMDTLWPSPPSPVISWQVSRDTRKPIGYVPLA